MTSSNGNIFRVTGPLCGEFTGHRWIPLTKASDAELWCFLWSAPWINGRVNNSEAGDLRRHRAYYDVIVMIIWWPVSRRVYASPSLNQLSTDWGRVTHICVSKITINGLAPGRPQAIIWSNAGILLIRRLGTNVSEISSEIRTFSLKKMHLKMSSGKWRPFCLGLNVLNDKIKLTSGGRLNKKDSLTRYGDSHVKDKTS